VIDFKRGSTSTRSPSSPAIGFAARAAGLFRRKSHRAELPQLFVPRRRNVDVEQNFPLTQIARQLGAQLQPNTFAQSFAEIEAALGHWRA